MSQILFYTGTKAQYDALTTKNENALYFLTDANKLYKGSTPFTHPVQTVSSFPASGEAGVCGGHGEKGGYADDTEHNGQLVFVPLL